MFFWSILNKNEDELVRQVFNAQQIKPVKGDWWLQVVSDLEYFKLNLDIEEISNMKRQKFKNIVKTATREVAREYLYELESKHSKMKNLGNSYKMQTYLTSENLSGEEKQLLFKLRTRTFDCKYNYKNLYKNDLKCFACNSDDTQEHLISCEKISEGINSKNIRYSDLFGSYENQEKAIKVFLELYRKRKILTNFPVF